MLVYFDVSPGRLENKPQWPMARPRALSRSFFHLKSRILHQSEWLMKVKEAGIVSSHFLGSFASWEAFKGSIRSPCYTSNLSLPEKLWEFFDALSCTHGKQTRKPGNILDSTIECAAATLVSGSLRRIGGRSLFVCNSFRRCSKSFLHCFVSLPHESKTL